MFVCGLLAPMVAVNAKTVGACHFDTERKQFQGQEVQQAQCLLRPVARWGKVSGSPAALPATFEARLGQPVLVSPAQLLAHQSKLGLEDAALGGKLNLPVTARYFVIHDTSSPWLGDKDFPADDSSTLNNLAAYKKPDAAAHVFVSRTGQTYLGHDFSVPWRATKLETRVIGESARGLFLHVELLQPRRRDPAGGAKNDALAPLPGFTAIQYERLALLYAAASVRAGKWLIPAMHAPIDEGLPDAHDDPQHFDLIAFSSALDRLLQHLTTPGAEPAKSLQPAVTVVPKQSSSSEACAAVVTGLAGLNHGSDMKTSIGGGKTWKALFDECDQTDQFAGQALPQHQGKPLRCSTDPNRVAFISRYPDGTVVFNAKAAVDADGSPVVGGSGWPNNVQTWLTYDKGSQDTFVNAEEVPFIVLPLPAKAAGISLMRDMGVGKGDLAVVVSGGRCSFALLGDAGPWFRLGEISMRAHEELGNPQCRNPDERPCKRLKGGSGVGIKDDVTYIVFPNSRPKPLLSQSVNKVVKDLAEARVLQFLKDNSKP